MSEQKKSMNPIPPTLRGKKRYVKFRLLSAVQLHEKDVWFSLSAGFSVLFGSAGIAQQRLWLIKWDSKSNEGIVRCSLREEENVKAGLLFVQKVGPDAVIPLILRVSGSVKKLK